MNRLLLLTHPRPRPRRRRENGPGAPGTCASKRGLHGGKLIENARDGNADVVKHFLAAGMDPEVRTKDGQTPLIVAALENKLEVAKLLLEHGADVNAKNKYNGTELMSAAWKGHAEMVDLLLTDGPDLSLNDKPRHDGANVRSMGKPHADRQSTLEQRR